MNSQAFSTNKQQFIKNQYVSDFCDGGMALKSEAEVVDEFVRELYRQFCLLLKGPQRPNIRNNLINLNFNR